jgi:hypothetical protein
MDCEHSVLGDGKGQFLSIPRIELRPVSCEFHTIKAGDAVA